MSYSYDEQVIEAAVVRRSRLAQALLFGPDRIRRQWVSGTGALLRSAFLAALLCAACVATSFVTHLLATDPTLQRARAGATPADPATSAATSAATVVTPAPGSATRTGDTAPATGASSTAATGSATWLTPPPPGAGDR